MPSNEQGLMRVLIIDTDNVRRGMLACTLPASSFSLEFAKTAERGLDLLGRLQPEVVIVGRDDSSLDLCQRIRSLPAGISCALLIMDEQFRDESCGEAAAEAASADASLPFPFETALLQERLDVKLRQRTRTTKPSALPLTGVARPSSGGPPEQPASDTLPEVAIWDAFRASVDALYAKLDALDYYQLLQVERGATGAEIKDAYFRCSMELHPDRFMQLEDENLREQIYQVYKRMSEAFQVLSNAEERSQYDTALTATDRPERLRYVDRGRQVAPMQDDATATAATPAGKRYLHFANVAETEGNLRSARMYLTLALQCEPQNSELRRRLDETTRRLEP